MKQKLDNSLIDFIDSVVKLGLSINIENIIIERNAVRAIDEDRSVVIYQNSDIPSLPFSAIGLGRTNLFAPRLRLIKDRVGFQVEVETDETLDEDQQYAMYFNMKSDDTRISYRCANPETIQAPKAINDTIIYQVQLNSEAVGILQRGGVAMDASSASITGDENGVSFEFSDSTNDTFSHTFTSEVTRLETDSNSDFKHNYPLKTILALFKQNPDGVFEIGSKGILCISVNGLNVYVLPQV